jgi:hypothetical protein
VHARSSPRPDSPAGARAGARHDVQHLARRRHTGATVPGATSIPGDAKTFPPGRYVARLMKDDGYAELARCALTVVRR